MKKKKWLQGERDDDERMKHHTTIHIFSSLKYLVEHFLCRSLRLFFSSSSSFIVNVVFPSLPIHFHPNKFLLLYSGPTISTHNERIGCLSRRSIMMLWKTVFYSSLQFLCILPCFSHFFFFVRQNIEGSENVRWTLIMGNYYSSCNVKLSVLETVILYMLKSSCVFFINFNFLHSLLT